MNFMCKIVAMTKQHERHGALCYVFIGGDVPKIFLSMYNNLTEETHLAVVHIYTVVVLEVAISDCNSIYLLYKKVTS